MLAVPVAPLPDQPNDLGQRATSSEPSPPPTDGNAPDSSPAAVPASSTAALDKTASETLPPALSLSITTQPSKRRIQVLRSPLLFLIQLRVSPGPTAIKSRLCPWLHRCRLHLYRRPCRPFPRRGSFRLGPAVAKLPLLACLLPPWTMVSLVRILLQPSSHDQPPLRASRARLGSPRIQRFFPGPQSILFWLCRFDPPSWPPHLPRHCLVHSPPDVPRRASNPAAFPEIPSPAEIECIESVAAEIVLIDYFKQYSHSEWAREQRAEPVRAPPFGIFSSAVLRPSPAVSSFTRCLTNALRCPRCAL